MITVHPIQHNLTICPVCSSAQTETKSIVYAGIHVAATCKCSACSYEYVQDLPTGHAAYYPTSIGTNDDKVYDPYRIEWFTTSFTQSYFKKNEREVIVDRIIKRQVKEVILINCLDFLYGHVLLKLFNCACYKQQHPEKGLIVIVPSNYKWLVPDYVDEIWAVDVKLSQLKQWFIQLDKTIASFLPSYTRVLLAYNYPHPYTEKINISEFTSTQAFDLNTFTDKPLTVTFIYRTDRLWHRSVIEYWLFLGLRKLRLVNACRFLFPGLQHLYITKLEKILRAKHPDLVFNVAGIGKGATFPASVNDLRSDKPDHTTEKHWCEAYAASHVVTGIHGSNMLLPTAHAAAFVELLPMDRTGNLTQDIITRYEGRNALYLGRFIPERSSPVLLAKQIHSIYQGWPLFDTYNAPVNHFYQEDLNGTFLKDLRKRILNAFKRNCQ